MASGVNIFERMLNRGIGRNKLLTKAGAMRLLRLLLGNFRVSGEGVAVTMNADGRLHLKVAAASDAAGTGTLHPFKVRGSAGSYTVEPGGIYTIEGDGTPLQILPTAPLGLPLKTYVFNTSSTFTGWVVLTVRFSGYDGGAMVEIPWSVSLTAAPPGISDRPLIRYNETNEPQDGVLTIVIADIVNGDVYAQRVTSSLGVYAFWNEIVITSY